jgi:hypothetical protein
MANLCISRVTLTGSTFWLVSYPVILTCTIKYIWLKAYFIETDKYPYTYFNDSIREWKELLLPVRDHMSAAHDVGNTTYSTDGVIRDVIQQGNTVSAKQAVWCGVVSCAVPYRAMVQVSISVPATWIIGY